MKTFATIAVIAVLLTALALPAAAGTNDKILIGMSAYYNGISMGSATFGTQPGSIDGVDSTDKEWGPPVNGTAEIDSSLTPFSFPPRSDDRWQIDKRAPLAMNGHKYWDLKAYMNGGDGRGTITITAWVLSTGVISSDKYSARLWLGDSFHVRTGRATLLWTAPYNASGSSSSPQFTRALVLMPWVGYQDLTLEMALIPEPGAMASLLAGLAGLAGFALRRRR